MSFVRTLATLAVGFAAAKGVDKFKSMGGMAGIQEAMKSNPAMSGMQTQMTDMMEKMGLGGQAQQMQGLMQEFSGNAERMGGEAMAGLGSLMSAFMGAAATGSEQGAQMLDAMTGTTAATDTMEENAKLMIRAMIQAAKADGEIDAAEQAQILEMLGDEVDADERAFVQAELAAPVDPHALAADTGAQMKAQVYATSLMVSKADKVSEKEYLETLAEALQLDPATRARVHASMGVA